MAQQRPNLKQNPKAIAMKFTNALIKDIFQELEMGMRCAIHRESGKVLVLPSEEFMDHLDDLDEEESEWEKAKRTYDENEEDYYLLEPMDSHDSFKVMERFTTTVENPEHRAELERKLEGRKPFRAFKDALFYMDDLINDWYTFREESYLEYVRQNLEAEFREDATFEK